MAEHRINLRQQLAQLVTRGAEDAEIAAALDIPVRGVPALLKKYGYKFGGTQVRQVRRLAAEGKTARQIGTAIGMTSRQVNHMSRKCGIAMRGNRDRAIQQRRLVTARAGGPKHKPYRPRKVAHPPAECDGKGAPYTVATIRDGKCRWPHGDVGKPEFHFCGRASGARVYCEFHTDLSVSRSSLLEDQAA